MKEVYTKRDVEKLAIEMAITLGFNKSTFKKSEDAFFIAIRKLNKSQDLFLTEDFMARIKELWAEIQEMADNGYDAEDISRYLFSFGTHSSMSYFLTCPCPISAPQFSTT